jgi:hypothetical protein
LSNSLPFSSIHFQINQQIAYFFFFQDVYTNAKFKEVHEQFGKVVL